MMWYCVLNNEMLLWISEIILPPPAIRSFFWDAEVRFTHSREEDYIFGSAVFQMRRLHKIQSAHSSGWKMFHSNISEKRELCPNQHRKKIHYMFIITLLPVGIWCLKIVWHVSYNTTTTTQNYFIEYKEFGEITYSSFTMLRIFRVNSTV